MTAAKCRARESIDFKDTPPSKKVKLSKQPPLSKNGACKSRPKPLVVDNVDTQAVPSKKLSKKTPMPNWLPLKGEPEICFKMLTSSSMKL